MARAILLLGFLFTKGSAAAVLGTDHIDADKGRILGGGPVELGELNYQLSIRVSNLRAPAHSCGASLVKVQGIQVAITASHCLLRRIPEQLTLVGGNLLRNGTSTNEQTRQVVDFVVHEEFDLRYGPANDLAVLFIDKPFTENKYVGTIALPKANQTIEGRVTLSGWGIHKRKTTATEYSLQPSDNLNKVEVPVLDFSACKNAYSHLLEEFSDHFMCTGFMEDWSSLYKGSCVGDSGGPVVGNTKNGSRYLAGVISFGKGCQDNNYPSVNMKVSHFVDWINDEVRKYKAVDSSEESREDGRENTAFI